MFLKNLFNFFNTRVLIDFKVMKLIPANKNNGYNPRETTNAVLLVKFIYRLIKISFQMFFYNLKILNKTRNC